VDAIEILGLRKQYERRGRRIVAIDGLDLAIPEGSVFGLLGPNGSGKTTTLRCLLGLAAPTSGTCRLLGADCRTELPSVIRRVGALVEEPGFSGGFSARLNLELLAGIAGIGPRAVEEALNRVGLSERADDPVHAYSLGMRQRLGIAAAILKNPDVLILDEPANGLDPAGIAEVRDLLSDFADDGKTVVVASHLLSEIERSCHRVTILAGGRAVATGTIDEVIATADRGVAPGSFDGSLEAAFLALTRAPGLDA
jgi:ABC-2 type transport system ATP-binding protein